MIDDSTLGVHTAGVSQRAWIYTLVVYTRVTILTFDVRPATRNAYQPLADLTTSAIFIPSAK